MKEKVAQLFESLKAAGNAVAPEAARMVTQGSMEIASALFNGSAYVPYGPGQYTPDTSREQQQLQQLQQERGGIER